MKNKLLLDNKTMDKASNRLTVAVKNYMVELKAEKTCDAKQMNAAIEVLRAAKVDYVGGIVIPGKDSIEVLHGADKDNHILGQLIGKIRESRIEERYYAEISEAVREMKAKERNLVEQAKLGDALAIRSINSLDDMDEIIIMMTAGMSINWRDRRQDKESRWFVREAGTGRRARKDYRLVTRNEAGEMIFCKSMEEVKAVEKSVKKVAKKQNNTVVYVEGDKGYTAPKGYATPSRPKNTKEVVVTLPEVNKGAVIEKSSVLVSFANLQLFASGSASTSTNNTNNTNKIGGNENE